MGISETVTNYGINTEKAKYVYDHVQRKEDWNSDNTTRRKNDRVDKSQYLGCI